MPPDAEASSSEEDQNEYEQARLARIKRNQAMLAQLKATPCSPAIQPSTALTAGEVT